MKQIQIFQRCSYFNLFLKQVRIHLLANFNAISHQHFYLHRTYSGLINMPEIISLYQNTTQCKSIQRKLPLSLVSLSLCKVCSANKCIISTFLKLTSSLKIYLKCWVKVHFFLQIQKGYRGSPLSQAGRAHCLAGTASDRPPLCV